MLLVFTTLNDTINVKITKITHSRTVPTCSTQCQLRMCSKHRAMVCSRSSIINFSKVVAYRTILIHARTSLQHRDKLPPTISSQLLCNMLISILNLLPLLFSNKYRSNIFRRFVKGICLFFFLIFIYNR